MKVYTITVRGAKEGDVFNWVNEKGQVISRVPLDVSEKEKEIWEKNHPGLIDILEVREISSNQD